MNDELKELERRLTLATASRLADVKDLDADAADLRAGWLALGELLQRTELDPGEPKLYLPQPAVALRGRLGLSIATLALALVASLLIAATLFLRHPAAAPGGATIAQFRPTANAGTVKVPALPANAATAWNDSLDAEIASAGLAVREVRENELAMATASDQIQYQMELLKRELEANPL